jgi:hypothetical protein
MWQRILEHWPLVEADLHDRYGIDLAAPNILTDRTWWWLRVRILGLLAAPPLPGFGLVIPSTRIGLVLNPPSQKEA